VACWDGLLVASHPQQITILGALGMGFSKYMWRMMLQSVTAAGVGSPIASAAC